MKANPIDVELMRSLLDYDPSVGGSCLRWKVNRYSGRWKHIKTICAGDVAGHLRNDGYWDVCVNGTLYLAHRIVWAIVYGEDPPCQVDHICGHLAGNHIENLRLAHNNNADNAHGFRKMHRNNTSGYPGVHKAYDKWGACLRVKGIPFWLGVFDTPEEAHAAYLEAKARLHTFSPTVRD